MSEPRKSDRWNSLLETLGVPVSEQPTKAEVTPLATSDAPEPVPPKPVSMLPKEKPKAAPKPKQAAAPPKSPSYWSRIAGALGMEVAPEPPAPEPPPVKAEIPPPRSVEPAPRAFERPSRSETPPRAPEPLSRMAPEIPPRSPLDDMFGAPTADVDVFRGGASEESPRLREPSTPRSREVDESGSVLDYDVEGGSDLPFGETAAREGGARQEEDTERDPRRRRRGRRRGRRGRGEERPGDERQAPPPRQDREIEPAGEEVDLAFDRDEELDLELGIEPSDEIAPRDERPSREERSSRDERDRLPPARGRDERDERGPRRGRHRGGRGRDRDRDEPAGERPGGYRAAEDHVPPPPERAPAPPRDERYDEEPDEHELLGEHEEGDDEHVSGVPTHKKIPTWDDAVGILIEANMANRAANPDRDRGRGRGGRGRGGRGR